MSSGLLPRIAREYAQLQQASRAAASEFALLELMPAGVYACDGDGRIIYFNRRAAELWGREPRLNDAAEKFCACYRVYLSDGTLVPPDRTPMAEALRTGQSFRGVEAAVERPDGSRFDASVTIDPMRDAAGRITGAINVFEDITARKDAERRATLLAELGQQLAAKRGAVTMLETAAQLVGEHLRVDQCFAQALDDAGFWRRAESSEEIPAPQRRGKTTPVSKEIWQLGAGERSATVVPDVVAEVSLRPHLGVLAALGVRAFVAARSDHSPGGVTIAVTSPDRRTWSGEEVSLLRDVAERLAPLVQQVRAEAEARARERDFRSLADVSPLIMWVTDAEGSCTYVSLRWREFTGQSEAEASGHGWLDAVHPEDRSRAGEEFTRANAAGERFQSEYRLRRFDGTYRWMLDAGAPRIEDGVFLGYVGSVVDITERKRTEETLRESEQRHREVAERLGFAMTSAQMGDWRWDAATNTLQLTGRAAELLGVEPGEVITREQMSARLHPDDLEPTRRIVAAAMAARTAYNMEYRLRQADGSYVWVAVKGRGVFDARGTLTCVIGIIQEITERKAAEEKLRAREEQLRFITSNAPTILSHVDREGRFLFVNKAFADRWQKAPEEFIGKTILEVAGEKAWRAVESFAQRVLGGETVQIESEVDYAGLGRRFMKATYSPEFGADGKVRGWLSAATDITERWQAEQALRESEARLRLAAKSGKLGIWDWDIVGDRINWSESLFEIHGANREDYPATIEGFMALIHPDDRLPVQRALQSSLEHDVPYELEFRALRSSGTIVWLFTNAIVLREGGRPVRMLGATFDITARKHAELALRESEHRFRTLASHAPVGIFLTDTQGDALYVNEAWRALAGLPPEQVRGKRWLNALHPDDRRRVSDEWYAAVQERRAFCSEYRFLRPDGTVRWLQGGAVEFRNASGAAVGYLGTVADITQRKTAEDALRESEHRFRTLASHAPVGIFLTDSQGQTIFVNESWCAMAGLTAEQAMGHGWSNAMHPDDRARVTAEWTSAIADNRASTTEFRFVAADGTVTWVQGNAVQLRDEAGRLAGYIGTIADFTQRKAAELRLRAQEAQLRLITTNAPIILAHCDPAGRYLFVNRAYTERFGLEPEQVIGRTVGEVLGAEAQAALRPHIARVLKGESFTFETEIPYPAIGRRFMRVAYTPELGEDGRVRSFLCAISDLTERRRMELALQDSEARFRQLADSMPQIVFAADANGNVDYYNRRWYELTDAREGETGDNSFLPVLHPEDRERCLATWYACVASGEPYQIEYRFRFRADDEYRWHLARALPARDDRGRIVRWFGTCTDIHDWKVVQEQLHAARSRLQLHADELEVRVAERTASLREAITQMEEFSYSVSHDLRAPLRAMNAYAQALVEDYGERLDATAKTYLERIQRSSVRMEKLTHDVLTFSRVARAEVSLAALDLERLVTDVIAQYGELQPPAARIEIARPLLNVRAHESSLGQCFANLLTNAAKFVPPGVTPQIRIRTEAAGERVRVWIEDNGIGIAPHHQARLFRVFERAPTRENYDGTGIGLAIVRKATEKMGGACGVESDGSNGSKFWIELLKV